MSQWMLKVGGGGVFVLAMLLAWLRLPSTFELHVLDVGQGDAILLRTPSGENVLVDGGEGQVVLEELGQVLSPLDKDLDLLILTHPHQDHVEGLVEVIKRFPVKHIVLSAPDSNNEAFLALLEQIRVQNISYSFADDDQDFSLGELELDFLFPFDPFTDASVENLNNVSPVVRAEWGNFTILLTGDAEQEVEAALIEAGVDVEADILKAGHHGSRTSSTMAFLEAVNPKLMLISCGKDNRYGHPHEETLQKAEMLGILVWRTDQEGRLSIQLGEPSLLRSIFAPRLRNFSSSF